MSASDVLTRFAKGWTRREWLTNHAVAAVGILFARRSGLQGAYASVPVPDVLTTWEELAQRGVDAAKRAGAQYAETRLTRTIIHPLSFSQIEPWHERIGVGVRVLVNGYWGFTAVPGGDVAAVERLAREAVAQAKSHARGLPRTADLGTIPAAVGRWTMPVKIDPFLVPFEEKRALLQSWEDYASSLGYHIDPVPSELHFLRHERVVATSEGARFTQTVYESGGNVVVAGPKLHGRKLWLDGLTPMGKGWELALEANIPEQLRTLSQRIETELAALANPKPVQIGRYTVVCDGVTMASLMSRTLAIATQLDRALGYEANTGGTSFLDEPLGMLGQFQVASPLVTITANRSAPNQLATVKWDDEGVVPEDFPLVKDGVLVDYQTTREQAAWLAPYYQRQGRAVRSHGCAAADSALEVPLQQTPNLALVPAVRANVTLEELVADVKDGILVTNGDTRADFQTRTGFLIGTMREIKNGRIGRPLEGGALNYGTLDLWKNITAVGGQATQVIAASSGYPYPPAFERLAGAYPVKGEPPQRTSHSAQAVAATIKNQAVIDLTRKA